jgi:hypothetical protein
MVRKGSSVRVRQRAFFLQRTCGSFWEDRRMRRSHVLAVALATLAGCGGSDSSTQDTGASAPTPATTTAAAPASDVASHVVRTARFLGFPKLAGFADQVRTDAAAFVSDAPFLYGTTDDAVADLQKAGFVAGIIRIFKKERGVGSSGSVAVELRDAKATAAEAGRQLDSASALPCPPDAACTRKAERFAVPGLAGAKGVDLTTRFARARTEDGATFNVTHDLSIVFSHGPFVHQLFAGGPGMAGKRDDLLAAAHDLYEHIS